MNAIKDVMQTTMSEIRNMIDVSNVVGKPITMEDNTVIIPVSKVSTGFVSGGGEYNCTKESSDIPSFGGGGGGVTIVPVAFVVVKDGRCEVAEVEKNTGIIGKIIDKLPDFINKVKDIAGEMKNQ